MARREDKSATESLLQIALGMEMAIVFFGALALNGLRVYPGWVVAVGAVIVLAVLAVLYRAVARPAGRIVGHVVQALLLVAFVWEVTMGLAVLVGVGFWIFGAIRGAQLDRGQAG